MLQIDLAMPGPMYWQILGTHNEVFAALFVICVGVALGFSHLFCMVAKKNSKRGSGSNEAVWG